MIEAALSRMFLGSLPRPVDEERVDPELKQRVGQMTNARGDLLMRRFAAAHLVIAAALAGVHSTWLISFAIGGAATAIIFAATSLMPGSFVTRSLSGIALQSFVALHVYQLHGMSEMHFFFFTAFTAMIVYQDGLCMWPGAILLISQHLLFAILQIKGYHVYFFEVPFIGFRKLLFHCGIALAYVSLCGYCAILLRKRALLAGAQQARLEESQSLLAIQLQISLQREAALVDSDERLREAQQLAHMGSWELDTQSWELQCSEEVSRILGVKRRLLRWSEFLERVHPDDRSKIEELVRCASVQGEAFEADQRLASQQHVNIRARRSTEQNGRLVGTLLDITERKRTEELLRASVAEKVVLLQEVHHRVKNNLQVISSLLHLQAETTPDEGARSVLKESERRVYSMALIHEHLYTSDEMSSIDFSEYVPILTSELFYSHGADPSVVKLNVDVQSIRLAINAAIPCGLMINELVTNALKHAFPRNRPGSIAIRLCRLESGQARLEIEDDGPGLPAGFDWRDSPSLGMRIIHVLAEQLDGFITWRAGGGTRFCFEFPYQEVK